MAERVVYQVSLKPGKIFVEDPNWHFKITRGQSLYLEKAEFDKLNSVSKIHLDIGRIIQREDEIRQLERSNEIIDKLSKKNSEPEKENTTMADQDTPRNEDQAIPEIHVEDDDKSETLAETAAEATADIDVQHIEPATEPKVAPKREVLPITTDMMRQSKKAIDVGIIGAGQGGSRIAESFYKLGYTNTCVVNTARQDLHYIEIPDENKLLLEYTKGGVGKDIELGAEAAEAYEKEIFKLMEETFLNEIDMILVCVGGGGGSGSGSAETLIKLASRFELPVNVLITIPRHSEDATTRYNALMTLDKLAKKAGNKGISGLIVVDNAKIQSKYPQITEKELWLRANHDITSTLDMFNKIAFQPTNNIALDTMDFARIFVDTSSCIIYGNSVVTEFYNEQALATSLVESLKSGLLAEGFNIKETVNAGVIICHHPSVALPSANVEYAFETLNEAIGAATVFRGLYAVDDESVTPDQLVVHCIFSGLGIPRSRIDGMMERNRVEMQELENKKTDSAKMTVFDDTTAVQNEAKKFHNMARKHTSFGRIGQRGRRTPGS